MKKLIISIILSFMPFTLCNASMVSNPYYCALYDKVKLRNEQKVVAVGIKQIYDSSVEVFVLGFGTPIKATFKDISIGQKHILKRRTITCDGEHVGQIRIYDLSFLRLNGGLFTIKSGDKSASTYIEIN